MASDGRGFFRIFSRPEATCVDAEPQNLLEKMNIEHVPCMRIKTCPHQEARQLQSLAQQSSFQKQSWQALDVLFNVSEKL